MGHGSCERVVVVRAVEVDNGDPVRTEVDEDVVPLIGSVVEGGGGGDVGHARVGEGTLILANFGLL